ncbi:MULTISPECIES: ricin-type beta-trefoil lectin domain protein [unclassified Streptomyces]|uniref:ricin-type beta-trefoil lectin domain protein n=1 Tax=unclassified Streptomyces TaxID=2593676 RepID=UPI002E183306|nr:MULTISPECIES: ricin-type beta-trefoil lectin domain protein [unclassified Streptomyces]
MNRLIMSLVAIAMSGGGLSVADVAHADSSAAADSVVTISRQNNRNQVLTESSTSRAAVITTNTGDPSQRWTLRQSQYGSVEIMGGATGKCLKLETDRERESRGFPGKVLREKCGDKGESWQRWYLGNNGDGTVTIRSALYITSQQCLDGSGGAAVTKKCDGSRGQKWQVTTNSSQ